MFWCVTTMSMHTIKIELNWIEYALKHDVWKGHWSVYPWYKTLDSSTDQIFGGTHTVFYIQVKLVFTGLYAVLWKTKSNLTASKEANRANSSQMLRIKCTWLTGHQKVWATLLKQKLWLFAGGAKTLKTLQASVCSGNDSTVRKMSEPVWLVWKSCWEETSSLEKEYGNTA